MSTIVSRSPLNISETVRDRGLVPKDHQYKMAYGEFNGHVTDDVMWPWKVTVWPQLHWGPLSRKRLKIQTWLQWCTCRKWLPVDQMVMCSFHRITNVRRYGRLFLRQLGFLSLKFRYDRWPAACYQQCGKCRCHTSNTAPVTAVLWLSKYVKM